MSKIAKSFLFVAFAISWCSLNVTAQSDIRLEIGKKLPKKYIPADNNKLLMTSASSLRPWIRVTIANVDYAIAYEKKTRKIKYIHTDDEDFRSSEGLRVNDELVVSWTDLVILGYFQLRAPAGSDGWFPIIEGAHGRDRLDAIEKAGRVSAPIEGFSKGEN